MYNKVTICYWEYKISRKGRVEMFKRINEKKKLKKNCLLVNYFFLIYLKFKSFKISNFTCLIILFKLQTKKALKNIYIYIYIFFFLLRKPINSSIDNNFYE